MDLSVSRAPNLFPLTTDPLATSYCLFITSNNIHKEKLFTCQSRFCLLLYTYCWHTSKKVLRKNKLCKKVIGLFKYMDMKYLSVLLHVFSFDNKVFKFLFCSFCLELLQISYCLFLQSLLLKFDLIQIQNCEAPDEVATEWQQPPAEK